MIKKIAAALLLVVIITGGTGCMVKQQQNETEPTLSVNGQALEYMEEKYGEPFYYYSPWGDSMSGTRQFLAVCDSMPDQPVLVQVENYRTEDKVFSDNYCAVKFEQNIRDYLYNLFSPYTQKIKIYHNASKITLPALPADVDFNTFFADKNCFFSAYVAIPYNENITATQIEDLANQLTDCGGTFHLGVVFLKENDSFPDVIEDVSLIISKKDYERYVYIGLQDKEIRVSVREGT